MISDYNSPVPEYAEANDYKPMDAEETVFSAQLFAALGNATRLRIAELLIGGEKMVNQVAQELGIHQSNASLNLAILSRAGIVKAAAKGNQRCYSLRGPRIVHLLMLARQFGRSHGDAIAREAQGMDLTGGATDRPASSSHSPSLRNRPGATKPARRSTGTRR